MILKWILEKCMGVDLIYVAQGIIINLGSIKYEFLAFSKTAV